MEEINGKWTLCGIDWNDEGCFHEVKELTEYIEKVGFLPLFEVGIPGFLIC